MGIVEHRNQNGVEERNHDTHVFTGSKRVVEIEEEECIADYEGVSVVDCWRVIYPSVKYKVTKGITS